MYGILNEPVLFNGLTLDPGTKLHFEQGQVSHFRKISGRESLIIKAFLSKHPIKVIVEKSKITLGGF